MDRSPGLCTLATEWTGRESSVGSSQGPLWGSVFSGLVWPPSLRPPTLSVPGPLGHSPQPNTSTTLTLTPIGIPSLITLPSLFVPTTSATPGTPAVKVVGYVVERTEAKQEWATLSRCPSPTCACLARKGSWLRVLPGSGCKVWSMVSLPPPCVRTLLLSMLGTPLAELGLAMDPQGVSAGFCMEEDPRLRLRRGPGTPVDFGL